VFARALQVAAVSAGLLPAAVALVAVPVAALGGLALGMFIGMLADLRARSVATGDARQIAAAGRRAGFIVGGRTAVGWLVLTGVQVMFGPVSWTLIASAVLVVLPFRSVRRRLGRTWSAVSDDGLIGVGPLPVVPSVLSTPELCRVWQRSYLALLDAPAGPGHSQVVRIRAGLLDELERRDRAGFARWLEAGARADSDPGRYLTTER
jgi:hypothetical protein